MTKFSGKVEIQDSISKKPKKPNTRITLDGDKSVISVGGSGRNGDLVLYDVARNERVSLGVENPLTCQDKAGKNVFEIFDATVAGLLVGTDKEKGGGKSGLIVIRDKRGKNSIYLDGANSLIDLRDSPDSSPTIKLNGNDGIITAYEIKIDENIAVYYSGGKEMTRIGYKTKEAEIDIKTTRPSKVKEKISYVDKFGIWISDNKGHDVIELGSNGQFTAGGAGHDSSIILKDSTGSSVLSLESNSGSVPIPGGKIPYCNLNLGGIEKAGRIVMRSFQGYSTIIIDSQYASISAGNVTVDGQKGCINIGTKDSIKLDGEKGDIFLKNADCAEDFDICESAYTEPGTVMVIENEGKLRESTEAYDRRVAGVISGADDLKPGIVLDKKQAQGNRKSISLMGKAYCKVDTQYSGIEVGDLLTTSATPGHAMKARDPLKSFGSVIGKALSPLNSGKGLIPILISLQ